VPYHLVITLRWKGKLNYGRSEENAMPDNKPMPPTFLIAAVVLFGLGVVYLFNLYPLRNDKFAIFLVSLFIAVMLLPMLKYLKFFDLIELRRSYKALEKQKR
jgi:hypothetical protein